MVRLHKGKHDADEQSREEAATVAVTHELAPVLVVKTGGPPELERMLATNAWIAAQLQRARASGTQFAVVLDVSGRRRRPTPEQQRAMGAWLAENRELLAVACQGWSMVVTSPVLRGVLTAITWFAPFPCPMKIHGTLEQGVAWCVEGLVAGGVAVPVALRDAAARRGLIEGAGYERLP